MCLFACSLTACDDSSGSSTAQNVSPIDAALGDAHTPADDATLAADTAVSDASPIDATPDTSTDINGNTTSSTFNVTVTDDEDPAISGTPADITQTNDAGNCSAAVTWTEPTASDNCGVTSFTSTHSPGATFAVGTTTVTYTAVDAAGNTTTSSFTVTVTDDEDPAITAASDQTVECDGSGNTTDLTAWLASNGGATATDNCTNLTWSNDYAGDCSVAGGDFTSYQQWNYGNDAGTTSGGAYMVANFDAVFPSGVNVGCDSGYELVFTSSASVQNYLPCTGTASDLVLSHSGPDPNAFSFCTLTVTESSTFLRIV